MMAIITSLRKGFDGRIPPPGWQASLSPAWEDPYEEETSIEDAFAVVYQVVDQETGCNTACSLLLDRDDAISLECLLKKDLAQRGQQCETLQHGNVVLACTPGAMPLISLPNRHLSIRFWRNEDYLELLCMLADDLYDPDADCPCDYERERD